MSVEQKPDDEPESRPCALCGRMLECAMDCWDTMQPFDGGELRFVFSYGSGKFDHNIGITEFRGLICDDCAAKYIPKMQEVTPCETV